MKIIKWILSIFSRKNNPECDSDMINYCFCLDNVIDKNSDVFRIYEVAPNIIDSNIDNLYPDFKQQILKVLEQANRECISKYPEFVAWKIFESHRSVKRQLWLYAQGRTRTGNKVTNLKSPRYHGLGLACDIVWYDKKNNPRWDGVDEMWQRLGHAAKTNGCEYGGDWKSFPDTPHIQVSKSNYLQWKLLAKKWCKQHGLSIPTDI